MKRWPACGGIAPSRGSSVVGFTAGFGSTALPPTVAFKERSTR
ncbi:hypothetical protein ABT160_30015 [Streptomyces sp. NPDC001941]